MPAADALPVLTGVQVPAPVGEDSRVTGADGVRPRARTRLSVPASTTGAVGTAVGVIVDAAVREPLMSSRLTVAEPAAVLRATEAAADDTDADAVTDEAGTPSARGASTVSQDSELPFWVARTDGAGDSSPYDSLFHPRIGDFLPMARSCGAPPEVNSIERLAPGPLVCTASPSRETVRSRPRPHCWLARTTLSACSRSQTTMTSSTRSYAMVRVRTTPR